MNSKIRLPDNQRQKHTRIWRSNGDSRATLAGSIVNATGKKLFSPRVCRRNIAQHFLDTGETCKFGDKCNFKHCKFPKDFPSNDIASRLGIYHGTQSVVYLADFASKSPYSKIIHFPSPSIFLFFCSYIYL